MKTKRIWAWVLCIVMLLTLAPVTGLASGADTAWAAETETWLSNTDNKLYVGEIRVTADNAANIIGSYTGTGITGTAYFRVENGVPTLYLSGVTIETGFKIYHYSREWYNFYGIYYKPASDDSLKIHFSGRNMINVSKDIAENKTFGIHADYNCKKLEFIGEENAYLGITAEQQIIAASGGALGLYGGEYNLLSENGSNVSSETLYCVGDLTIKDTAVTAVAKDDRAIWMNAYPYESKSTRIQNSTVHLTGGTDSEGLLSCGDLLIENSVLNTTGGKNGISCADGKAITISGADTVVTAESVGTVNELRHEDYAAMYTCADLMERILPDITFNDGLSITTPAGGTVGSYDFDDLTPGGYEFNTVYDADGNYARKVVIGSPTGHCVCGKDDCDLHTGAIMHVTENSLNRVSGIVNGVTLTSGSYYLSDDLTMNDDTTLTVSGTINLCLNGHTLRAYIVPNENAVLNICDCVGGGKISYTNKEFIIGFVHSNAVVNMYGGTLESVDANTVGDIKNLTGAAFNLYGGTISGGVYPAIGSESITLNLYSGKVTATGANGIVAQNGKVNLCGNTEISVLSGYHSIKVYNKGLIDATGYTGGNISILCSGLSDGDIVVENVTDATAGKFTLSNSDSNHILKRDGSHLVYTEVYTVTFDANGGSGTMADAAGVSGAYSLPECTFTAPTGKKFKAWKVNNTEYAPGTSIQVSSATTVTAVWKNIVKEDVRIEDEPQHFVYDDLAKGFTIRANVTGGFTVTYQKDGNAIVSPTDAGSYDVVIKRDADDTYAAYDKTIKGGLIITPMDITGKASAENFASMTYNGHAQTPQAKVTAGGLTVTGSWSAVTNVADTTTFTATGNFTGAIADRITGMEKASFSFTVAPIAKPGLIYNGSAQALTTNGSADGGEIRFSSSQDGNYSEDVITATNAGSYEVWYKVIGDNNHNDAAPQKINASIAKAQQAAPETPAAENETAEGKSDGKITGVDSSMEYQAEGASEYTAIDGNEIANLPAGTYRVRYKETNNFLAGADKTIKIAAGAMITVAFETGGGSAVESKTCAYNQTITAPETEPTKEGYAFAGWFADETLTAAWDFAADTLTENKTLYAKWVQGTISKNEGTIGEVTADGLNDVAKAKKADISLTVQVQETAEANADQTAIKGISGAPKNFGFYDIALKKSTGEAIADAQSVIEIKLPYDFRWKRNIKVYRCHNGNAQELTQLTERNTVKPFTDGTCFVDTEGGCIYIYSSKFSTYSVAYDRLSASSGSGSSGLARFTVRFETNGAAAVKSQTVLKGGKAAAPNVPERNGYEFGGWYLDAGFTKAYDFTAKVTENITLYAKWDPATEDKDSQGEPADTETHDCPSKEFDDLDIKLWYHPDTDYVLSNGLMNGTAEKTFAPDENLTRAMLVTVLYRNESEPAVDNRHSFTDVEKGAYYENAVSWALQNGVVKGISETEFAPDAPITREQIAAMMHRYAQWKGIDVSSGEDTNILSYSDFDMISEYAIAPLQWAAGTGLFKGRTEITLNPRDNATRAEIAAILHRFFKSNP